MARYQKYLKTLVALGKVNGVDYNIGKSLQKLYQDAGFNPVDVYYYQHKISAKNAQQLALLGLQEWKNKAIEAKLTTPEKVASWEEIFKSIPIDDPHLIFEMSHQAYVLAKKG